MIVQTNIPLHDKNWFKTGGPAAYFCEPTTTPEFQQALQFAHKNNLDIFLLGQGANILISDDGFNGLVIRPQLNYIEQKSLDQKQVFIKAGAGVLITDLIEYCLDHNIIGLEEFSGIPGTVGGAVYINLHYFEFLLEQFLVNAEVINKSTGKIEYVDRSWFAFGYNTSTLHKKNYYLLNATFKLIRATDLETAFARGRRKEIIRHRTSRYPSNYTCGSFFRNFYDNEVNLTINDKKMIYVAYYLDKIGVKGNLFCGDAFVSYQHANMLVNRGNATSSNIIELAQKMQKLVEVNFGVIPQPECQLIGFKEYPL